MRYLSILLLLLVGTSLNAQTVRPKKAEATDYQHSMTFMPFSGIVAYDYFNPAIGFDYEFMIDPEHGIGLHLPFAFGFVGPEQDTYNGYRHTTTYAAPGVRFHSANRPDSHVDFATGPSILIGNMHFRPTDEYYNPGIVREPFDYTMIGLLVDNSLNFYRDHFVFGFDVRLGTMMDVHDDSRFFINFGMHFGGRF